MIFSRVRQWLTMQTIKEVNSPINGLIKVMMIFNRPRLIMGDMLAIRRFSDKTVVESHRGASKTEKAS